MVGHQNIICLHSVPALLRLVRFTAGHHQFGAVLAGHSLHMLGSWRVEPAGTTQFSQPSNV